MATIIAQPNAVRGMEVTEHVITLMADAESHQELLNSMTAALTYFDHHDEAIHDIELTDGVATILARKIYNTIYPESKHGHRSFVPSLSRAAALQVCILLSALEVIIIRCSKSTLASCFLSLDLLPALERLVEIFSLWEDRRMVRDVMVRDMALSKVAIILRRVSRYCVDNTDKILDLLLNLVRLNVASDIRIDAALAVSSLLENGSYGGDTNTNDKIDKASGFLVATLTSTAASGLETQGRDAFRGLMVLASSSKQVRATMAKRRDTIMAVVKLLVHHSTMDGRNVEALEMTNILLGCEDSIANLQAAPTFTGELLLEGLALAATSDTDDNCFRHGTLCTLKNVVSDKRCKFALRNQAVMDALETVAFADSGASCKVEGVAALSRMALSSDVPLDFRPRILSLMVKLTASSNHKVRYEALGVLREASLVQPHTLLLSRQPELLSNIENLIARGTQGEKACALEILRQLAYDSNNRGIMSRSSSLTTELFSVLRRRTSVNRVAYMHAVETVLSLLSEDENVLKFSELLPWLVTFANATTSDDQLKIDIVEAIVRVSKAILA